MAPVGPSSSSRPPLCGISMSVTTRSKGLRRVQPGLAAVGGQGYPVALFGEDFRKRSRIS